MRLFLRLFIGALALALIPRVGWAHAFLDHAEPAVGSQIHTSPTEVRIWFTERLEPVLSRIQVFDAANSEVDKRNVHIDGSNPALLEVALSPLPPGKYRVVWRVVSVDTHVTTGDFTFVLAP
jgi:methionine-rich copper-binding protein CopC